jgi:hypothetical protein
MFVIFSYVFGSHLISANITLLKQKKDLTPMQELRPISLGLSSLPLLKIKPIHPSSYGF